MTHPSPQAIRRRPLWPAYACESLSSIGSTLLMTGIFFYTQKNFGWGLKENFSLAAAEGVFYVAGSLASQHLAGRFGRRRLLIAAFGMQMLLAATALAAASPAALVVVLVAYTLFSSLVWPALESLIASEADAHEMSRRIGRYNLVWSATNAVTYGVCGWIIANASAGMFVLPAAASLICTLLMLFNRAIEPPGSAASDAVPAHADPEPELLARRTLALWLARIALPATYVVIYSLSAMMPSLPVMERLSTEWRTAAGCTWMIARVLTFATLSATVWWHTRPKLLLVAAFIMLFAFLGVTRRPSDLIGAQHVSSALDLMSMLAAQVILGASFGVIYCGSLYFGMVLSEGSTEHGGYHEALIGLGSILGPGSAALTQWRWPGNVAAGAMAVSCIVAITLAAAVAATVKASRKPT